MKSDLRTIRRVANMTDSTITGNRKSDIGSDNNKEIPLAGNSSYSRLLSNLGESFMILSTTNTTVGIRDHHDYLIVLVMNFVSHIFLIVNIYCYILK